MTEIVLDGVIDDRRQEAEAEIKQMIELVFPEPENPIDSIIVTNAFREKVCEIIRNSKYDPKHEYGTAAAKTIPLIKGNKLVFALILDGKIFGRWSKEEKIFRTTIFLHEFTHVNYEYLVWLKIGTDAFFKEPVGYHGSLIHNASIAWQEYYASRVVMTFLAEIAVDLKGKVQDNMTAGNTEQLYTIINGMRNFAKQAIDDYKRKKISLEDLGYAISSRIVQALILWAYTIPAVGIVDEVTKKYAEIEKLEDFELLSENLQHIHLILEELYEKRKEYLPTLIEKIALEINLAIQKCGLTFTDLPNGSIYLSVSDVQ